MLEPILAQMQQDLIRAVLGNLQTWLAGTATSSVPVRASQNLRQWVPSAFDDMIEEAANRYDIDSALVKAVVKAESGFSPSAVSRCGAKGLMQLMDATARQLGVTDSFDPAQNIDGGVRYLRQMLDRYEGDTEKALAAYNAGPGSVDRWGGVPPYDETQAYVPKVIRLRDEYRAWTA